MTFSQIRLLQAEVEELDRQWRWKNMTDEAREAARQVRALGHNF